MGKQITISIPIEIKRMFNREKYKLNNDVPYLITSFEKALIENDVTTIYTLINSLKSKTTNKNKNVFFKEYIKWLDFALKKLLEAKNIILNEKYYNSYLYYLLILCQKQLNNLKSLNDLNNIEKLISNTEIVFYNSNKNISYDPVINDICRFFMYLGVGIYNPKKIADISYNAYLNSKKRNNKI